MGPPLWRSPRSCARQPGRPSLCGGPAAGRPACRSTARARGAPPRDGGRDRHCDRRTVGSRVCLNLVRPLCRTNAAASAGESSAPSRTSGAPRPPPVSSVLDSTPMTPSGPPFAPCSCTSRSNSTSELCSDRIRYTTASAGAGAVVGGEERQRPGGHLVGVRRRPWRVHQRVAVQQRRRPPDLEPLDGVRVDRAEIQRQSTVRAQHGEASVASAAMHEVDPRTGRGGEPGHYPGALGSLPGCTRSRRSARSSRRRAR